MPLSTTECDALIASINNALPNEHNTISSDLLSVLLQKQKWTLEEAFKVLMGGNDIPVVFHNASTLVRQYDFSFSMDDNTHVIPKPFLLWCREQGIVLRKQLSIWLDADDNKEFACASIEWEDWAHPYRDYWSIGVLACLLANISPVIEITYILHNYPEKTAFALGCNVTRATQIIDFYKQLLKAVDSKAIHIFERFIMENGKLKGISVSCSDIEAWMNENNISMPPEFITIRTQIFNCLKMREEGNKQWVNLVNGTDESRYNATSQPTLLKKVDSYYEKKLVFIGLVTFMLLDLPYKRYKGKETEQILYEEWKNEHGIYTDYPWAHMIYGALREAVILEEISPVKTTVFDDGMPYEFYEVSLTSALSWCREQGVMLDGFMLAHIGEVKNILPDIPLDMSQQVIRKQHTIERNKRIKLNVTEAYNNLKQRTSIHNITKKMIANELMITGKSEGIKEMSTLLRLFSKNDYMPQKSPK